jgi:hypothetical protein
MIGGYGYIPGLVVIAGNNDACVELSDACGGDLQDLGGHNLLSREKPPRR